MNICVSLDLVFLAFLEGARSTLKRQPLDTNVPRIAYIEAI
jgi:hypothetical protein